ncbi:MAG: tRNA 2-thiouridine(34) synthase MnmA [Candidatus Omnitrophota bacterium]
MKKKIAVGLSGGIDSSFAAYLLVRQGWDVVGFTLKFYPQENRCCDLDSLYEAQRLCHKLGIPHYVIDAGELFKKEIIAYFIESYLKGMTPNPCAFCNRFIKFGYFLEKAKSLGIDYVATGHYARIAKKKDVFLLKRAKDNKKSQEYFLSLIKPAVLGKLVFPLGNYLKEEVKKIVQKEKVIFKPRKESQDICFVEEQSYAHFIEKNTCDFKRYEGDIRHVNGTALGKHKGIYRFTYGQRGGLGIGWSEPLYVAAIDARTNTVVVGEKKYLYKDIFLVQSLNWFSPPEKYRTIKVKIRYNSPWYDCRLKIDGQVVTVSLKEKVAAITPGQIAVFYHNDMVVGAGIISKNTA